MPDGGPSGQHSRGLGLDTSKACGYRRKRCSALRGAYAATVPSKWNAPPGAVVSVMNGTIGDQKDIALPFLKAVVGEVELAGLPNEDVAAVERTLLALPKSPPTGARGR